MSRMVYFSLQPDGFVGDDNGQLSFRASGVEGTIAPSGYSAGANAEESAAVVTRVGTMNEAGMSLEPSTAKIQDCNREGDLINEARSHPGRFDANHQLGVFYFEHDDIKQSIAYLAQASAIEPVDIDNARWLALAYIRTDQPSKAIALMQSLLRELPGDPALLLHLAQIYEATGDRPRAIAQYVSAAKLNATADNLFACGMGLVSLGAVEDALPLFTAAAGHNPASARLWMGLGIAQSLSNRRADSERSLLRAADLDPDYLPAWFFLAALPGQPTATDEEVRRRLAVLVVSHSGSAELRYDYALALWKHYRKNPSSQLAAQIEAQLSLAIVQDPNFSAAHFQLGTVYEQAGDYAQAASELERAVQLDPGNAAAHYRLAQAYQRINRAALADHEMTKFEAMRSEQPQEDELTEAGLRAYTAQFTLPISHRTACHEPH